MKRQIIHILFIALVIMAFPFHSLGGEKVVDFNFPQDVSKEALADIDKALKGSDDGQLLVDALVRYSVAQSGISQDNMADIVSRIETTAGKEKRPHIRALLYHLDAMVYQGYRNRFARWSDRDNPVEEVPQDISEWDRKQFDQKITELIEKSLAEPEALKAVAVTSLTGIIRCNKLGATYIPTLNEFLLMKGKEILNGIEENKDLMERINSDWMASTEGNLPAHIFAITETQGYSFPIETYQQYQDNEYCALLLNRVAWVDNKLHYKTLKEYAERFPNSIFTTQVKNTLIAMERKTVQLTYPEVRSSSDSISVKADVQNTNSFTIEVYRIPDNMLKEYRLDKSKLQLVSRHPVTVQGNVPFEADNVVTTLPPLPYGIYAICPAFDFDNNTEDQLSRYNILHVTDIATFALYSNSFERVGAIHLDGKTTSGTDNELQDRIIAVDINTGKPLSGVAIMSDKNNKTLGTTGSDGSVIINLTARERSEFGRMLTAVKGNDRYGLPTQLGILENNTYSNETGDIYTDLGVYRPGETIHWAAIIYRVATNGRVVLGGKEAEVIFMDQNREPIDTVTMTTDEFGRIEGTFVVPKDRMNGSFTIFIKEKGRLSRNLAYRDVNVSEYKTPTFEVTFPVPRRSYVAGQPVKVSGQAMTYSGLPLQNTEVRLSLAQNEWNWWRVPTLGGSHLQDTTVVTDDQGHFTIEYPAELFEENIGLKPGRHCWARYLYRVDAIVTTDAGETHQATTAFIVGSRRGIVMGSENNDIYLNDKPIKLPLKYVSTDEKQTDTYCTWEVTPIDGKEPVLTGNFNTADPTIDLKNLPSGQYMLKIHIIDAEEGEQEVDIERMITLYRKGDKKAPVKDCPLWLTPLQQSVDKNNVGHIAVGVSTPKAYIYYVARTSDKVIAHGWLTYNAGIHDFTVKLPKEAGKDVNVWFITHYDTKQVTEQVTLQNPYKAEAVKVTATSFRDKLVPGDMEKWTFSLTDQNGKPVRAAMMIDMFDKAIASIQGNEWAFKNWQPSNRAVLYYVNTVTNLRRSGTSWMGKSLNMPDAAFPKLPSLYTYDQGFFDYGYGRGRMLTRSLKEEAVMSADVADVSRGFGGNGDAELSEVVVTAYGTAKKGMATGSVSAVNEAPMAAKVQEIPEVNAKYLDNVILRESDVKTALWQPILTSDLEGNISIEFEVPNFNTTWFTQTMAWDKKMIGSTWMAEVLTQKPLMVRSNMPRFLRQGDKAALAATVQNATDQVAACDAVIELFDPRSGDIYATRNFNLQLDPKGSQAVTIDWLVPDTISMAGFRIKAANGRFGDGEQVMVPVLTTISPVIETEPFYIEAAQSHFEAPLPKFLADARVTLEYCDNPTWYCVLALPTIFSDEYHIATQAAHSLFALEVAQGVAKEQPQIKEAITYWKQHDEDSTLVSMLQKNQDLKIGTLLASPWMRDADRQTLRMSKLHELFDDAIVKKEYEKIITALQSLQMDDGGFTWFRYPNCKSSVWTTGTVLQLIGEIKHLGYLPDDKRLTEMTRRALAYYDSENVSLFNKAKKYSKEPYGQFAGYAYTRTLFPDVKQSSASADLLKKTVKYMDKNWSHGLTLKQKAYCAMTLNRNGYQKTASQIVESIRQFAIVKPSLGMYWDNLQTGFGWWELDKVAYTSTILQAMSEVDPRQEEIDQIRKWMLLMKQSNDWGSYSLAADAVYSILSTGSQWLDRGSTPSITVAGEPINLDKMAQWLGYFRTTLPATTAGSVVIDRTGSGPAWGSIYSQFKAPMTEIKEKAIEEVSISKEYYVYAQDGSLHQATSFQVGDKVKVRVIIKTNKDMDFVTITDERAACFEPVDQLSGYRSEDRTWFYLETKDTQTNVFFNSLSKGTHIIGYDVWVTNPGEFTSGIATIQCQYAPQLSAHSAGKTIIATPK